MQALILAGGLGTRLRSVVNDRPKPMADVNGKPFLWYIINNLKSYGIYDIILAVGYKGEIIKEYFSSGEEFGVSISYSFEEKQLGTAGAIKEAEKLLKEQDFFVLNGDTYLPVDYLKMMEYHKERRSSITIGIRKVNDVSRYGSIAMTEDNKIVRFVEKNQSNDSGYINGGIYLLNRSILSNVPNGTKYSLETELMPSIISNDNGIFGYKTQDYFIDIGLPNDYYKFIEDVSGGCVI